MLDLAKAVRKGVGATVLDSAVRRLKAEAGAIFVMRPISAKACSAASDMSLLHFDKPCV